MNERIRKAVGYTLLALSVATLSVVAGGCSAEGQPKTPTALTASPQSTPVSPKPTAQPATSAPAAPIAPTAAAAPKSSVTVTDLIGRKVQVPSKIERIGAIVGPSYEKIMLLGQAQKISMMIRSVRDRSPWAVHMIPNLKDIMLQEDAQNPNIETIMQSKLDVIFAYDYPRPLEVLSGTGIPVVVAQKAISRPSTRDSFIKDWIEEEVNLYGECLGPEAKVKAAEYIKYFNDKVKQITSVTDKIPDKERPRVYYIVGPDPTRTHVLNTNTYWYVQMAGGDLVTKEMNPNDIAANATMEQILKWDPEIVAMGRVNSTESVVKNPAWSGVSAVKNGKVFVNPDGVMKWDYSSEGVLLMLWFAKTIHPDKFADLDVAKEVSDFYQKFYGYKLTPAELDAIMKYLPPPSKQ